MKFFLKRFTALTIAAAITFSATAFAARAQGADFEYLSYPAEAVSPFAADVLDRVGDGDGYDVNDGYDGTSLFVSPYWRLSVNGEEIPLYASLSYDRECGGVLSSYQYIFPEEENFVLDVGLTFVDDLANGICLPEYEGVSVGISGKKLTARLDHKGIFTFLVNNDDQRSAVTLFVREYRDEEAEIADYREQYGEENVTVFDKGYYELDELSLENKVTYFRRGAFVRANHLREVTCPEEDRSIGDFMYMNGKSDAVVTGFGTVDFTPLDWHERDHCIMRWCKNVLVEGLMFLNPSSWTFSTYACEDCVIRDIAVIGYRVNSDGIDITCSTGISVSDSFCRNGDDCFQVKTTNDLYEAKDIVFTNCVAWSNKARCFGITGEIYEKVSDVEFSHCAVVYRNAIWDNDRVCSLTVMNEYGGADVENVVFRDIEIYHDSGRPILIAVWNDALWDDNESGCAFHNIRFENIVCKSAGEKSKISAQRDITDAGRIAAKINMFLIDKGFTRLCLFARISEWLSTLYNAGSSIGVTVKNVRINGSDINIRRDVITEGNAEIVRG